MTTGHAYGEGRSGDALVPGSPSRPPGAPRYFENWIGYVPPYTPHGPIEYDEAEASRAYVVFTFDAQGRAVSFDKWLITASERAPSILAGRTLPAGKLFFVPDAADGDGPGRAVSLDETQGLAAYYRAHVHPDGTVATLEHVRRQRMTHHEYRYWEDGQLREFRYDSGGERGVEEYDRAGYQVNEPNQGREG
jgi:hypothetical protein